MATLKQIFGEIDIFDPLVFDTDDRGFYLRARRRRDKIVDYEMILKNAARR